MGWRGKVLLAGCHHLPIRQPSPRALCVYVRVCLGDVKEEEESPVLVR